MSLRQQLKRAVARCVPYDTRLATFDDSSATGSATPAQRLPENPHGTRDSSATGSATPAQHHQKTYATVTPEKAAPSCVRFASELTAQRVLNQLLKAAMRACDHWGDGEAAREEMRRDVLNTPPELRRGLLDHLSREYPDERDR